MACIQRDCSCEAGTVAFQPLPAFTLLKLNLYYLSMRNDNCNHGNNFKTKKITGKMFFCKLLKSNIANKTVLCMKCFNCCVILRPSVQGIKQGMSCVQGDQSVCITKQQIIEQGLIQNIRFTFLNMEIV